MSHKVSILIRRAGKWKYPFDYRQATTMIMEEGRAESLLLIRQMAVLLNARCAIAILYAAMIMKNLAIGHEGIQMSFVPFSKRYSGHFMPIFVLEGLLPICGVMVQGARATYCGCDGQKQSLSGVLA